MAVRFDGCAAIVTRAGGAERVAASLDMLSDRGGASVAGSGNALGTPETAMRALG